MANGRRSRPKLEDIPEDTSPREAAHRTELLRWELEPVVEFFQQAKGVLALLRWLGPITTILLGAILVVLIGGTAP